MVGFGKEIQKGERNFYKKNIGNAVNLFSDGITFSGDIYYFDEQEGNIILTNYIEKIYIPDGDSYFWENPGRFEISIFKIWGKSETTREDRLGRIANYNRDLMIQESEQQKKLENLLGKPLIILAKK